MACGRAPGDGTGGATRQTRLTRLSTLRPACSLRTRTYTSRVLRAVSAQEKVLARSCPAVASRPASWGVVNTCPMASAAAPTSSGAISHAASPQTSGMLLTLLAMTGAPDAIASSGGSPKPSTCDRNTKSEAPAYASARASSVTKPDTELERLLRSPVGWRGSLSTRRCLPSR